MSVNGYWNDSFLAIRVIKNSRDNIVKIIPNAKRSEVVKDGDDLAGSRSLRIRISEPPETPLSHPLYHLIS